MSGWGDFFNVFENEANRGSYDNNEDNKAGMFDLNAPFDPILASDAGHDTWGLDAFQPNYAGYYISQHPVNFEAPPVSVGPPTDSSHSSPISCGPPEGPNADQERSEFQNKHKFASMDELVEWCRDVGRVNGYALVTKRTIYDKPPSGQPLKIWLTCDCAGEYKSTATVRRSGTRKTGCKFQLIGAYKKRLGYWDLRVEEAKHNHKPFLYPEGHPSLMRLTPSEERTVEKMTHQNIKPRYILAAIKEHKPHNISIRNTIYNARAKLGRMEQVGETPMQILFDRLEKVGFVFYHRTSQNGERVEDVFFIHPESNMLWRTFPHVLLIDSTYKTNRYKMPLVHIIGVTSTLMSFCIAHAFVSNEKQ
ncbi:PKS-NRPS hybrid synthetase CHGG_01239-like [Helianthus annuus]|uniref:PKS-NRPS hybrid synthetase CHGG_01239-like n=1 Tax=Helianthus annuus TaxID=4232 RepID=UPI000B8FD467|nr:PKS-NRPS hybrid synthetase CHGG_01239-like [Helianthus annuus]